MKRASFALSVFVGIGLGWLWVMPGEAAATVEGPCTSAVAGQDVTVGHDTAGTAIDVRSGHNIQVSGTSQGLVQDLSYTVHVAGAAFQTGTVALGGDGRSWSGSVPLESLSAVTVGLFEVTADVQTDAGSCAGKVFICITGKSPLATAAGASAAAVGLGGLLLLGFALLRPRRMKALGSSVSSFSGGATAALGTTVLLQQTCVVPLTIVTAAAIPAAAGVAGIVASSLTRRVAGRGARRMLRAGHPGAAPGAPAAAGGPSPAPPPGAGTPGPGSGPGGGPAPAHAPGSGPGGGPTPAHAPGPSGGPAPAPAPGGGPSGGPAPAGPGGPSGGPAPAPPGADLGGAGAPTPAGEAGVIVPPIVPIVDRDRKTCPNCGSEIESDVVFCTNCGTRLDGEGSA